MTLLLLVVLVAAILAWFFFNGQFTISRLACSPRKLMTSTEQLLYFRLSRALPDFCIFPMVPLSRVLKSSSMFDRGSMMLQRLDYVICKPDMTVIAAIALDDLRRPKQARPKSDKLKEQALQNADILFLHIDLKNVPDEETIKKLFRVVH